MPLYRCFLPLGLTRCSCRRAPATVEKTDERSKLSWMENDIIYNYFRFRTRHGTPLAAQSLRNGGFDEADVLQVSRACLRACASAHVTVPQSHPGPKH